MMIREKFFDVNSTDESLLRKPSKRYISTENKELGDIVSTINRLEPIPLNMPSNISKDEERALKELILLSKSTIEIKKADKTSTIVIMDKKDYSSQLVMRCHLQTEAYEKVESNIDSKVYKRLNEFCTKYSSCITENERKVILDDDWKASNFYALPKINKCKTILDEIEKQQKLYIQMPMPGDLTSRPIVSGPKSVTKGISKLLEKILTPLVGNQRSYIKDERDFLRKFPSNIGPNSYVLCCDVISLYTSIPNELGLQAIEYWVDKLKHMIPSRFTKSFILEGIQFVLENNYFCFNDTTWHQLTGTAMGKEVASPYACLTVGFLEETKLFPCLLPSVFGKKLAEEIIERYYRFVDDGITAPPDVVEPEHFKNTLNQMNPAVQFTITKPTPTEVIGQVAKSNNFLSLKVYTTATGKIITDIYYKETNTHEYLHYNSHHPAHVKNNIPYCLAKTIIISTSDGKMMENNLNDLRKWLGECGYPNNVIQRGIFNARLQGPANIPSKKCSIPFISTYYSNLDSSNIVSVTKSLIENSKNPRIQEVFGDVDFIHARRQPPNILSQITNAAFITSNRKEENGIFHCSHAGCKICRLYLKKCKSFKTRRGTWDVKCHVDCNSKNVIYYQVCNFCRKVTNTGKTDDLRQRTNNHITGSRYGKSSNKFDQHNFKCPRDLHIPPTEPFFDLYVFMVVNDYNRLRSLERKLHLQNHDTINATNSYVN